MKDAMMSEKTTPTIPAGINATLKISVLRENKKPIVGIDRARVAYSKYAPSIELGTLRINGTTVQ
jgi:hypothetical protein